MKLNMRANILYSKIIAALFIILISLPNIALSLSPEEKLADPILEERATNLFTKVRCLICKGQVILSSDNNFSFEMRNLIRKKINEGLSDQEIIDFLTNKYGNDILNSPKFSNYNEIIIWLLPIVFVIVFTLIYIIRTKKLYSN
jgi:cytochrome c-type biogenesis protein CcmH